MINNNGDNNRNIANNDSNNNNKKPGVIKQTLSHSAMAIFDFAQGTHGPSKGNIFVKDQKKEQDTQ